MTGGLAAPLIATGVGAIIGTAGGAALGSLAGVAIISSLFGVAGAGLTGDTRLYEIITVMGYCYILMKPVPTKACCTIVLALQLQFGLSESCKLPNFSLTFKRRKG